MSSPSVSSEIQREINNPQWEVNQAQSVGWNGRIGPFAKVKEKQTPHDYKAAHLSSSCLQIPLAKKTPTDAMGARIPVFIFLEKGSISVLEEEVLNNRQKQATLCALVGVNRAFHELAAQPSEWIPSAYSPPSPSKSRLLPPPPFMTLSSPLTLEQRKALKDAPIPRYVQPQKGSMAHLLCKEFELEEKFDSLNKEFKEFEGYIGTLDTALFAMNASHDKEQLQEQLSHMQQSLERIRGRRLESKNELNEVRKEIFSLRDEMHTALAQLKHIRV